MKLELIKSLPRRSGKTEAMFWVTLYEAMRDMPEAARIRVLEEMEKYLADAESSI